MRIADLRLACLALPGAEERRPFASDPGLLALTVGGKWFALLDTEADEAGGGASVNLKTDPEEATALRRAHGGIVPGWHMNKRHWNTVFLDSDVPDELILALVEISHGLVLDALPRRTRLLVMAEGERGGGGR
ncbi:MmcQ/YjbR family DNA-binding protein [Mycetocola reblochoni]|nr:MmcQ/YjbR family DNA-binding protein [Mycetocola reblochoni]RLP71122.1 MmcQ/YjbR family DNA-binding protein [Mycetocola reblochoni]